VTEQVKRLQERRARLWEELKGVADRAAEENRALEAEEERQWTEGNAELDALDVRIKAIIDGETRAKEQEEAMANLRGPKKPKSEGESETSVTLRAFLRGERGRFIELGPQVDDPEARATLSKLFSTTGAATVPTDFYSRLVAHLIETSAVLQAGVTTLNTEGGAAIQIPKTTAHSTNAVIVSETSTIPTNEPAFGQVTLQAFKYGALMQVSRELLDDNGVDLEGYLAMQAGRALGNGIGNHLINGTGTTQPRGVLLDATTGVTGATGVVGVPTPENLIDLFFSVIAPYRQSQSCRWITKDSNLATIRKFRDAAGGTSTTGNFIWQPGLVPGVPDTLLGKPILTDPFVPAFGTTNKAVVFGDFSQYFVRLTGGVRFERSDDFAFSTDLVTFRALLRGDGALVDTTGAVKTFVGGAT
jgi:HK97 family phage major capsid protein